MVPPNPPESRIEEKHHARRSQGLRPHHDPDITPAAALFQIPRVAAARKLPEDELRRLVEDNTTGRLLGVLGEPHVNVLKLNLALDELANKS